uniref:Uncharacterized protein n=1 Tax=Rhizophora mucronata TaxID=61149 RepID=A0A2P2LW45_RHIMU
MAPSSQENMFFLGLSFAEKVFVCVCVIDDKKEEITVCLGMTVLNELYDSCIRIVLSVL